MKKKKSNNVFINTRDISNMDASKGNARNRLWWENMPMTYKNWEGKDRELATIKDFNDAEEVLFSNSPYLREQYNFSACAGKKVLDLGCGSGVLSIALARNGADVTAVDLTENATKMTKRNSVLQKLNIKVVRSDAENMAFANNTFDYVLSWGVLHHTEHTEMAFNEVSRVLKPNGTGLVMVYHKSSIFYYVKGLIWLLIKGKMFKGYNLRTVIDFYVDGYFHRHFTKRELSESLQKAGLIVQNTFATQQEKKILPFIPKWLDLRLKYYFGWYLISTFKKF
jgi:2-polyprenyl-3-methyl-5-hydroxy-6-metoxy-1,4-benzoquinol methylase